MRSQTVLDGKRKKDVWGSDQSLSSVFALLEYLYYQMTERPEEQLPWDGVVDTTHSHHHAPLHGGRDGGQFWKQIHALNNNDCTYHKSCNTKYGYIYCVGKPVRGLDNPDVAAQATRSLPGGVRPLGVRSLPDQLPVLAGPGAPLARPGLPPLLQSAPAFQPAAAYRHLRRLHRNPQHRQNNQF